MDTEIITITITPHAKARMLERMGLKKRSVDRVAVKALVEGQSHSETTGVLKDYLDKMYVKKNTATNMKVSRGYVFLFNKSNVLFTVYPIPETLKKAMRKE